MKTGCIVQSFSKCCRLDGMKYQFS